MIEEFITQPMSMDCPEDIIKIGLALFCIKESVFVTKEKKRETVDFRRMCMVLIKQHFPALSLYDISIICKRADHTTVIANFKVHKALFESDRHYNISFNYFSKYIQEIVNNCQPHTENAA